MRPRGTIKSRSPGSYRIRYSLGRDPVSGRRKFATATVRGTRKEAEQELVSIAEDGSHWRACGPLTDDRWRVAQALGAEHEGGGVAQDP